MTTRRLFVALFSVGISLAGAAPAFAVTGTITGTVTDADGAVVSGICVERFAVGSSGRPAVAASDEQGRYTFNRTSPGRYLLYFAACQHLDEHAYAPEWFTDAFSWRDATPVVLGHLETRTADAAIGPGAIVEGTVTDGGLPIRGICATLQQTSSDWDPYRHPGRWSWFQARSGADGRYSVPGNVPGDYRVYFRDCRGESASYVATWHGTASGRREDAVVLTLSEGIRPAVDQSLVLGATVFGRVTGPSGEPLPYICVSVIDASGAGRGYEESGDTTETGDYRLQGVPPDDARILFSSCYGETSLDPEYHPGVRSVEEATHLSIGGGAELRVDASLTRCETAQDLDGDGLSYCDEITYGSYPFSEDSDADQIWDGAEVHTYGTDPADADTDGDGFEDGTELFGGTCVSTHLDGGSDPLDASSTPLHPSGSDIGALPRATSFGVC